tara:strand:+ start:129 stop:719 length:591 start_codon:yes stop_codon:yes gene_type:complete
MTVIVDGTGTGNQGKIDLNNRLHTKAITDTEGSDANVTGRAFNINTGELTLTSANESAVLYYKNNEIQDYVVTAIAVGLGPSTGGASTDIPVIKVTRNPTGGTIVDDATAVDINSNRNYGSSLTLTADTYKGGTDKTFTGDTDHIIFYQGENGRLFAGIDTVLPKGTSMGITITPATSNTSMTCYAALIGYLRGEE